jgi:autotransporter-associated beta strand protein
MTGTRPRTPTSLRLLPVGLALACALASARAADRTWHGTVNGPWYWTNAANWGGVAPASNDALYFAGGSGLANTNNFTVTNSYTGLTFNSGAGAFTLAGSPIILSNGLTNNSSQSQAINLDIQCGDLTVRVGNGGTVVLNGSLRSDTGALTKFGPGTLALNGINNYPGGTTIRQGTVSLRNTDGLGASGGALVLDGGSLEAAGSVTLNNRPITLNPAGGTFNMDPLSTLTATNEITGPGPLTKIGAGTLRLAGSVTASGPVSVNAGTLLVDGLMAGPSSLAVNSGGVLGGAGFVVPDVFVADGGMLCPGTNDNRGPATLTCSNLVLSPNAVVRLELNVPESLGGTNDLIVVHGNLTLGGILKVTGKGNPGVYPIIKYEGALTDNGMQLGSSVTGTLIVDTANKLISINASSFPSAPPAPMRVLFIGNSLTYTYDIPGTIQHLANSAGDWLTYASDLPGGTDLAYHLTDNVAMPLVDSGNFDIVMLQEYSSSPSVPSVRNGSMFPAARTFNTHIIGHGARTMFYETWGYPNGDPGNCYFYDTPPQYRGCDSTSMLIAVRLGYARIANELGAAISPVGLAWLAVRSQRPDINLYSNSMGDYHPGPTGAYLAACVHYASILGRSPVGNSYTGLLTDKNIAAYLQTVAEQTVFQDPWAFDQFGFAPNRYYWASSWANYTNRSFTSLNGVVISGNGGLPSPSVKVDVAAGQTNNVYLGVYGYNYESAGQGRLYLRPGGSLAVTGEMVVGKEGQGWVQHDGGSLQANDVLAIAEQPSSRGTYTLAGGSLLVSQWTVGGQGQGAVLQNGGTCEVTGTLTLAVQPSSHGTYTQAGGALLTPRLTVGQQGQAAVQQNGGSCQVSELLQLADQPWSAGAYALTGGTLWASRIERGQGSATFVPSGGQFSFAQFGSPTNLFNLDQSGGSLEVSNATRIFGDYTLQAPGTLHVVLGNDTNWLVSSSGTVALAGSLSLSYAAGFVPAVGQQFRLVTANGITGRFSQVLTPPFLPGGAMLVVTYTPTSVLATVASPVPLGIIGWWPGEGNADDLAGASDGVLLGGATATDPGMVGQAFNLDGANGYVSIPDSPILRPTNLTVEAWVLFTSLDSLASGGSPAGEQYIVFKQNTRSSNFEGIYLGKERRANGDVFVFETSSASGAIAKVTSATTISTGVWYHVASVRGSNFTQLYVNGQLESQTNVAFPQDYGDHPLFFGSSGQSYWDHKLAGLLDEVSLYDRPLAADEIAAIYAAGPAGKCREAAVSVLPHNQTALAGSSAAFAARPFGPVSGYQWVHNGTNTLAGATNSTLLLPHVTLSQAGNYSVIASNFAGVVVSESVSLEVTPVLGILMGISLSGGVGSSYRIDYVNSLGPTNDWAALATITLTNISQVFFDNSALTQAHRFYRVVPLAP